MPRAENKALEGTCNWLLDGQVNILGEKEPKVLIKASLGCWPGCGPVSWRSPLKVPTHLLPTLTETVELGVLVP